MGRMLVTDHFVFVHMPKTGGGFLRAAIVQSMDAEHCGSHISYREVPAEYSALPAICFMRNPWDWYVSLWAFQRREGSDETFSDLLSRAFARTPDLYSLLFRRIGGIEGWRDGRVEVGRFEHLREDFVAFLDRHDIELPRLREFVLTAEPINTSERDDYRSYYDDESRELVGRSRLARHYEF